MKFIRLIKHFLLTFLNKKMIWFIATIGIISNLFDAVTTFIALNYFGKYEINPFMKFFFDYPLIGYPLKIILGTIIFIPLSTYFFDYLQNNKLKINEKARKIILLILIFILFFIIYKFIWLGINNILVILK